MDDRMAIADVVELLETISAELAELDMGGNHPLITDAINIVDKHAMRLELN